MHLLPTVSQQNSHGTSGSFKSVLISARCQQVAKQALGRRLRVGDPSFGPWMCTAWEAGRLLEWLASWFACGAASRWQGSLDAQMRHARNLFGGCQSARL